MNVHEETLPFIYRQTAWCGGSGVGPGGRVAGGIGRNESLQIPVRLWMSDSNHTQSFSKEEGCSAWHWKSGRDARLPEQYSLCAPLGPSF